MSNGILPEGSEDRGIVLSIWGVCVAVSGTLSVLFICLTVACTSGGCDRTTTSSTEKDGTSEKTTFITRTQR